MTLAAGMAYFAALGERVEARWRAQGYADAALPAIAAAELRRRPPHRHVSPWDLAQLGRRPRHMPAQGSAGFGQPPLAVWGSGRMYIEVLYWLQATTAIHQHSFSGAFAVLAGSSLHTQYTFRPTRKVSDYLHVGRLAWTSSELLTCGAVHEIHPGPQFIHALFHLEHPSVSVVVRNYADEDAPPQLGYFPPGVGTEDGDVDPRFQRALELYRMLVDAGRVRDATQLMDGLARDPDLASVYQAMAAIGDGAAEQAIAGRVRARARAKHGAIIDTMAEAIDREAVSRQFTALRARVTDPDLRFFLALLLVVPTPAALRRLILERAPTHDVATTVTRWLTALATIGAFPIPLDAVTLRVIDLMMRGQSLAKIVQAIAREGGPGRPQLAALHAQVKALPYLARLVAAAQAT